MRGRTLGMLCAWVTWLVASLALADVVVIVPPHIEQGVTSEQSERALDALSRALKVDGFDLVLPGQAGPAAEAAQTKGEFPKDQDPMQCVTPDCASAYRKLFDAVFAVQMSMFREPGQGISLTVLIVDAPNEYFSGAQPVEGGDITSAARDAYREARKKQAEGVGPWLTVTGSPEGATVYVDGYEFGRIPVVRRRIAAGMHRLELRADGYSTLNDTVDVPERIDHEEQRAVTLEPLAKEETPVAKAETKAKRHWLDYAVGGAGIAAGAAFVSVGVWTLATEGDCAENCDDPDPSRRRNYEADTLTWLNLGGGAAAMLLGAATIWVGPFGMWLEGDSQHATLRVQSRF